MRLWSRRRIELAQERNPARLSTAGGLILGKITGVEMTADAGTFITQVTIQSALGYGTTVVEVPGIPTYVADGYVTNGYQMREGQRGRCCRPCRMSATRHWRRYRDEDGIRFPAGQVHDRCFGSFYGEDQRGAIRSAFASMATAAQATTTARTEFQPEHPAADQAALANANSVSTSCSNIRTGTNCC